MATELSTDLHGADNQVNAPQRKKRFWKHFGAAVVLSLLVLPLRPVASVWNHDEGVVLVQARQLATNNTWPISYLGQENDEERKFVPYVNTPAAKNGLFTYVKHPTYPLMLSLFVQDDSPRVFSILPSLFGFLLCLCAIWLLCSRLSPGNEPIAMWLAFASPLFVHGYIIWAHTIAISLFAFGLIMVIDLYDQKSRIPVPLALAAVFALFFVACLFRTDASLAGASLTLALFVMAIKRRSSRSLLISVFVGLAFVSCYVVEKYWINSITGGGIHSIEPLETSFSYLYSRYLSLRMLLVAVKDNGYIQILALVPPILLFAAAVSVRKPDTRKYFRTLVQLALLAFLITIAMSGWSERSGLFAAWPIAALAIVVFSYQRDPAWNLMQLFAGVFLAVVVVIQYTYSGGVDWGGRYISILLPLLIVSLAAGARWLMGIEELRKSKHPLMLMVAVIFVLNLSAIRHVIYDLPADKFDHGKKLNFVATNPIISLASGYEYPNWQWAYPEKEELKEFIAKNPNEHFVLVVMQKDISDIKRMGIDISNAKKYHYQYYVEVNS